MPSILKKDTISREEVASLMTTYPELDKHVSLNEFTEFKSQINLEALKLAYAEVIEERKVRYTLTPVEASRVVKTLSSAIDHLGVHHENAKTTIAMLPTMKDILFISKDGTNLVELSLKKALEKDIQLMNAISTVMVMNINTHNVTEMPLKDIISLLEGPSEGNGIKQLISSVTTLRDKLKNDQFSSKTLTEDEHNLIETIFDTINTIEIVVNLANDLTKKHALV